MKLRVITSTLGSIAYSKLPGSYEMTPAKPYAFVKVILKSNDFELSAAGGAALPELTRGNI